MSLPQALFLDLDETLVDRLDPEVIIQTCAEIATLHPDLDAARLAAANREVWDDYWPQVEHRWTLGELDGAAVSLEAWRRALRKCGYTDEAVAERTARIFRQQSCAAYRLFDDVHDLLAAAQGPVSRSRSSRMEPPTPSTTSWQPSTSVIGSRRS